MSLISPTPAFPLELVDLVLDHSHSDKSVLASCSLVCKNWFASARYHLFHTTTLDADNASTFAKVLSPSSTLPRFIRRIDAKDTREDGPWLPDMMSQLAILTSVTSISITSNYSIMSRTMVQSLRSFARLVELRLVDCAFSSFTDVQELICSFPSLEVLHLEVDWLESRLVSPRAHIHPPSNLRELYLRCDMAPFFDWMLSSPSIPLVSTLTLHNVERAEIPSIDRYLRVLGPSLRNLTIFDSAYGTCLSFILFCLY